MAGQDCHTRQLASLPRSDPGQFTKGRGLAQYFVCRPLDQGSEPNPNAKATYQSIMALAGWLVEPLQVRLNEHSPKLDLVEEFKHGFVTGNQARLGHSDSNVIGRALRQESGIGCSHSPIR
jgi:hypothetical protein